MIIEAIGALFALLLALVFWCAWLAIVVGVPILAFMFLPWWAATAITVVDIMIAAAANRWFQEQNEARAYRR